MSPEGLRSGSFYQTLVVGVRGGLTRNQRFLREIRRGPFGLGVLGDSSACSARSVVAPSASASSAALSVLREFHCGPFGLGVLGDSSARSASSVVAPSASASSAVLGVLREIRRGPFGLGVLGDSSACSAVYP